MATPKSEKKKRKNKRKSRTEVSPSPDPSSSPSLLSEDEDQSAKSRKGDIAETDDGDRSPSPEKPTSAPLTNNATNAEQAFADFYLRQATTEFADDLDKLRSTGDFHGQRSVDVLVAALKQGTACYGRDERLRIGSIAAAAKAESK